MTKRADGRFGRAERDFYPTPAEAVTPLLWRLRKGTRFYEPCAGNGTLSMTLVRCGMKCVGQSDLFPQSMAVKQLDARKLDREQLNGADAIVTNPPWERKLMHELIEHLRSLAPTWLLLDADWLFTQQAAPFLRKASVIIAIGRIKWFPGSAHDGFDNHVWVRFEAHDMLPVFIGR